MLVGPWDRWDQRTAWSARKIRPDAPTPFGASAKPLASSFEWRGILGDLGVGRHLDDTHSA
jgi:hypothetical protein